MAAVVRSRSREEIVQARDVALLAKRKVSHPWPATIAADVRFNKGIQFRITWGRRRSPFPLA